MQPLLQVAEGHVKGFHLGAGMLAAGWKVQEHILLERMMGADRIFAAKKVIFFLQTQ